MSHSSNKDRSRGRQRHGSHRTLPHLGRQQRAALATRFKPSFPLSRALLAAMLSVPPSYITGAKQMSATARAMILAR